MTSTASSSKRTIVVSEIGVTRQKGLHFFSDKEQDKSGGGSERARESVPREREREREKDTTITAGIRTKPNQRGTQHKVSIVPVSCVDTHPPATTVVQQREAEVRSLSGGGGRRCRHPCLSLSHNTHSSSLPLAAAAASLVEPSVCVCVCVVWGSPLCTTRTTTTTTTNH